ncbi:glycosyltransferase [Nostoc sp. NIES-2111]
MSTVSVIIPNFNRENLIGETIQNMLRQSLPAHEVIVVDDGSSDRSVDVIRSFGSKVTLIQQKNQGPGAARNAGLAVATGDYIQFMDSDDLASRNKLESQVAILEREGADIVYSPWAKVRINGTHLEFEDDILQTQPIPSSKSMLEWFLSGWSIVLQSCLFRRTVLDKAGQFQLNLISWEDGEYFVRLLLQNPRIVFTPDCLTLYRLHNTGKLTEQGSSVRRRLNDQAKVFPQIVDLIEKHNIQISLATRWNFSWQAWKLWRAMAASDYLNDDTHEQVQALWHQYPQQLLSLYSLIQRLAIHLHWRKTGVRWIPAYQSARPAKKQIQLVQQLGFEYA